MLGTGQKSIDAAGSSVPGGYRRYIAVAVRHPGQLACRGRRHACRVRNFYGGCGSHTATDTTIAVTTTTQTTTE